MKVSLRKYFDQTFSSCLAVTVILAPMMFQNGALACGPFFDNTAFSLKLHPDSPFKLYARGQIGIVHSTYGLSYQIAAFRYLSGKPLTANEQAAYVRYWHNSYDKGDHDDANASAAWLKDRAKVGGDLDKSLTYTSVYRQASGDSWPGYLNCPSDAFKTASATLSKLVAKYGADSAVCKEWLKGQDAVFCHCQSPDFDYRKNKTNAEPGFPQKLPDNALLELRQDRQYQMAAAYFYAQKLDDALNLFTAISEDKTSPWQTIAHYMVARTLIRKGTLSKSDGHDAESLARALVVLKQLSSSPDFTAFKKSINDLVDFIQLRLEPAQSCQDLSKLLASPYAGEDLGRKIDNYIFAMSASGAVSNGEGGAGADGKEKVDGKPKVTDRKAATKDSADELTSWISCFNLGPNVDPETAAEGFKTHRNLAWAIVYASKLKGNEPEAAEVESFLSRVPKSDPGFISASYYRAILLLGGKHIKEAEGVVTQAMASANLPPSAANDLARLQLDRATTVDQFFALSFRPPAAILSGYDSQETPDSFDVDEKKNTFAHNPPVLLPVSAALINATFPLTDFAAAVSSKSVAPAYVKQFAQATFARAIMLGDYPTALKMTPILKQSYPSVAKLVSDFELADTTTDKEFAAVFLMLRCPGMRPTVTGGTGRGTAIDRIDDYSDNWWDKDSLTASGDRGDSSTEDFSKVKFNDAFLSEADKKLARAELAKLKALGEAPNYLGKIVVAYARAHPSDPRVPEALALTVKATHLGSGDQSKTTAISTQAFQILHKSYPGNQWTKKTPYHY